MRTYHKSKVRQILWSMFFGAALVFGLYAVNTFVAPKAKSVTVCDYLDANPTIAGVEDLVGKGIVYNKMAPYELGQFIRREVDMWCPRHLPILQAYVNKWNPGAYVA